MLEEQAIVTRTDGRSVYIKSLQSSACGHCLERQSCGTVLYAKLLPNRELALTSDLELHAGDKVIVGIEESYLLRASLFMYLLPLLILLISVGLFEGSEQATALFAFFSLASALFLIHHLQKHFTHRLMAPPQIVRKL